MRTSGTSYPGAAAVAVAAVLTGLLLQVGAQPTSSGAVSVDGRIDDPNAGWKGRGL